MVRTDLRQAVANCMSDRTPFHIDDSDHMSVYNDTYRKGKASQYTHENVCIVPGGRAGLSRIAAVIGDVYTVR